MAEHEPTKEPSEHKYGHRGNQFKDITGQQFGRLLVLRFSRIARNGCAMWECRCDCGNLDVVNGNNLRAGRKWTCHDCARYRRFASVAEQFWSMVRKSEEGCWVWEGAEESGDYGVFHSRGVTCRAHRFSYQLAYGEIPQGLLVCHHCDNPPCVRPDHLFLGTHKDNAADRVAKGRSNTIPPPIERRNRGERCGMAKLTAEQVRQIRSEYKPWVVSTTQLAAKYGVSNSTIWGIVHRLRWGHLD